MTAFHNAFKAGINFVDSSPFYGATKAETMLGKCLQGLPRSEIIVSTKCGRYGQEDFDFSAERVTASVTESLQRLQTDYIDIIQCHDIEFGDLDMVVNETLPALVKLKQQGLVKFVGITGLPFHIFHYVLDRVPPGTVDVVLSYCHNSLNDSTLQSELAYLQSKGVGIISASPLSMGLLTKAGPPEWHPAPQKLQDAAKDAAQRAGSKGVDIAKLAIMESMRSREGISSVLLGMATPEQVESNIQWTLEALELVPRPDAAVEAEALAEVKDALADVQGLCWPSGKPENN